MTSNTISNVYSLRRKSQTNSRTKCFHVLNIANTTSHKHFFFPFKPQWHDNHGALMKGAIEVDEKKHSQREHQDQKTKKPIGAFAFVPHRLKHNNTIMTALFQTKKKKKKIKSIVLHNDRDKKQVNR